MHPVENKTLKIIRQEKLLKSGERVLVGVSAGSDSMALLHVLSRLAPLLNNTVAALYVNHGLRPSEADDENLLVKTEAQHLGIDFFSENVDVKMLAGEEKISIEHAARLLRYEILEKTASAWGAAKIAVAHTADDQAEEILLRLIRGTGRKGLAGMKLCRDGKIIRPFLGIPKSDLLAYLDKYSIPFLYDSSNSDTIFLRNRVRNELLPYLASHYNTDIRKTLLRTANILQDEEEYLEISAAAAFEETVSIITETCPPLAPSGAHPAESCRQLLLNRDLFGKLPRALQRRLLEKCCWRMDCEPSARKIESLLQLTLQATHGTEIHLANGLRAVIDNEQLCFSYPSGRGPFRGHLASSPLPPFPVTFIHGPGIHPFHGLKKRLLVELVDEIPSSAEISTTGEFLNSSLFSFPLILRGSRPKDRFHPLGAPGTKKVNDFLRDRKIARHARMQIPVLCTDVGIIAIPGLRIDHRYRVTETTTNIVRIRWEDL